MLIRRPTRREFIKYAGLAAGAAAVVQKAQATMPATSLWSGWDFNEGSGTTVADASGNGHTLTVSSGAWTTVGAKAGVTCGSSITIANPTTGLSGAQITIFADVHMSSVASTGVFIDNMFFVSSSQGFMFKWNASQVVSEIGSGGATPFNTGMSLSADTRTQFAVVVRGTGADDWRAFKNGSFQSSFGFTNTFNIAPGGADNRVGSYVDGSSTNSALTLLGLYVWTTGWDDATVAAFATPTGAAPATSVRRRVIQ